MKTIKETLSNKNSSFENRILLIEKFLHRNNIAYNKYDDGSISIKKKWHYEVTIKRNTDNSEETLLISKKKQSADSISITFFKTFYLVIMPIGVIGVFLNEDMWITRFFFSLLFILGYFFLLITIKIYSFFFLGDKNDLEFEKIIHKIKSI